MERPTLSARVVKQPCSSESETSSNSKRSSGPPDVGFALSSSSCLPIWPSPESIPKEAPRIISSAELWMS